MDEKESKRVSIIVEDESSVDEGKVNLSMKERLKKPIIFTLMAIAFLGCLYLIFKPVDEEKNDEGLKNAVPEATDKGLQADKQAAYEKQMIEDRDKAKRNSLMSLSEYWNNNDSLRASGEANISSSKNKLSYQPPGSLASYQNAQQTLGAFYRDDDREKLELRRKVDQLQDRLSEKDIPAAPTLNDQLALMEKSYEMASRYLPAGTAPSVSRTSDKISDSLTHNALPTPSKELLDVKTGRKNVVSELYREPDDSSFLNAVSSERNRTFITPGSRPQENTITNSIRASVMERQTISERGTVKLRLRENAVIGGHTVMEGSVIVAEAKFAGSRLHLKVSSVEVNGNILPVELLVYDLDGQLGLYLPGSDEINAAGEIAANMSQGSGTNIMMSRSAGQQVAGDLSRGLIQGVSGFFSKKLRTVKVTLKAGHQVWLVTKK